MNDDIRPPKPNQSIRPEQEQNSVALNTPPADDQPNTPLSQPTQEVEKPRRPHKLKLILTIATGLIVFITVLLFAGWVWYQQQLSAVEPGSDEKVKITIVAGADSDGIAKLLKQNGLIRDESAFGWYIRLSGTSGLLQSGAYRLAKSDDVPTLVEHLTSGKTDTFSITFLPGNTLAKHRQVLIDAGYAAGTVDAALSKRYDHPLFESKPSSSDLEGYIYGETYQFAADATPEQILVRSFDQFQSVVAKHNLKAGYKKQGFSLYEGITLASIIQREVITKADMAQASQVFQLRLKRDIQLGSDVTYQYIADKLGVERRVDLDSPYNTRRYGGLPPGPIASPGESALAAVATPARGDYIYFLSGDDDKTYFARTEAEHEANIRNHCQKKCQII